MIRITGNPVRFQGVKEAGSGYAVAGSYTFHPTAEMRREYGSDINYPTVLLGKVKDRDSNAVVALTTKGDPRDRNKTTVYLLTGRHAAPWETESGVFSTKPEEQFPGDHPQNWGSTAQKLAGRLKDNYQRRRDKKIPYEVFSTVMGILTGQKEELGCQLYKPLNELVLENPGDGLRWTRKTVPMEEPKPSDTPEKQLLTRFDNWQRQFMADLEAFHGEPNYEPNRILIDHYLGEMAKGLQDVAKLAKKHPLFPK